MDTGIALSLVGIIVSVIIGVFWLASSNKKKQSNKINFSAKDRSTINTRDVVAGDSNSDMSNKDE
ncbi:MAG: hypothetical protein F9K32_06350 [Desulfobulbaceae bacterium]|nr:MAG: hypothetical protein F9K32_06350 [Desulfobulbaceae bacterium]